MNPCPTPPVCEFGRFGNEATFWWFDSDHVGGGVGGIYGMCGHRPVNPLECLRTHVRGDRMGQRPEVDTVNVVPCDRIADE